MAVQVDTQQAFQLIDRVLPFEACLYHQIVPLSLTDNRLNLGMVTLQDAAALDYVRRLLAFMNYSLVPQSIASETHYAILSAYLNHTKNQPPSLSTTSKPTQEPTQKVDDPLQVAQSDPLRVTQSDRHSKATFLVDAPDQLDTPLPLSKPVPPSDLPQELQSNRLVLLETHATDPELARTFILNDTLPPQDLPTPGDALPILEVTTYHLNSPVEVLETLPPTQLLQELLGRILIDGIGRLYFERRANSGRILWSQNGVLQSVLDDLSLDLFQGVIRELKLLTHLPLLTVQQPKQVEIERTYQRNRLLLRLRVMPNAHGEEATLQILRGAALKFHQQQQLANLGRDALTIAQELQKKVNEIRDRTRFDTQALNQTSVVSALIQVLQQIEQQLEELKGMQKQLEE